MSATPLSTTPLSTTPCPRQRLHPAGPEVSSVVWGLMRLPDAPQASTTQGTLELIAQVLALGITTMDHADIYGGYTVEARFGEALARAPGLRHRMELISKCGIALHTPERPHHRVKHYDTRPAHVRASVERSLRNLRTDYLDLLLVHRPDPLMDAQALGATLDALIAEGKVRHVGVSNHTPAQVALVQSCLKAPLVTQQIECSLLHTAPLEDGTLNDCQLRHITPMVWSPLAGGQLPHRGPPALSAALANIARSLNHHEPDGAATVALSWVRQLPLRPVLVSGSMQPARLASACVAASRTLDHQDWYQLLEAARGCAVA